MRKFYAAIALCITLIGTFAPVVFSVSTLGEQRKISVQKNVVSADYIDVSFGKPISIVDAPVNSGYYRLETTIRYDGPGATGASFNSSANFGSSSALDPHYQVINTTTGTTVIDKSVSEPEKLGLKDAQYGPMRQDIEITTPGKYEAWFYEDYVTGNNLLSSKIKFEITADKKIINTQISQITINVRGDDQIGFTEITADITEGSDKAKFTIGVTYKNNTKQSTDEVEENLYWSLKDSSGNLVKENAINLNPKPKYNTQRTFSIELPNLEVGKKYTITFIAKDILSTQGNPKTSQEFPFTAGTPVDNDAVQQQIQQDNAAAAQQALDDINQQNGGGVDNPDDCKIYDLFCHMFRMYLTFVLFVPNTFIAITGVLTDWSIHYSISSDSMRDMTSETSLVYMGWKVTRDFANIGFIFALFIAAFSLILNKNIFNFEPKKTVVRVIIMALLINFSMMFCRLIIQTGDLFANILYSKINVEAGDTCRDDNGNVDVSKLTTTYESGPVDIIRCLGIKGITTAIISQVNPQKLLMNTGADYNIDTLQKVGVELKGWAYYVQMGFLSLIIFFITFVLIYIFTSIALMFSSRVFMFWILIIISPIAFVSHAIPQLEDSENFGFNNWLDQLVKLAFSAPIFLFFVYLVIAFLNTAPLGLSTNPNWGGFWGSLMVIITKLSAVVFILMKGKKIAFELGGKAGVIANKIIKKTTGAAVNAGLTAATGGMATIGRQVVGRAGAALAESGAVKGLLKSNSFAGKFLGQQVSKAGKNVSAASFDIRDTKKFKGMVGNFNKSMGENIEIGENFGRRKGGFEEEGGVRDIVNRTRKQFEEYKMAQDEDIVERLKPGRSSKEERDKRAAEAELERQKQAAAAEESKIENEAMESDATDFINKKQADAAKAQAEKQNLEAEKTAAATAKSLAEIAKNTAETQKAVLEGNAKQFEVQESSLKTQKKQLEQQKNNTTDAALLASLDSQIKDKQSQIEDVKEEKEKALKMAKEKADEVKAREGEIKAKEAVIKNKEKDIKEKDTVINKAATYASVLPTVANVRQAQQEKRDLEALEAISVEKKDMVSAEEKMQKQDEKRKKLLSDIEALGKKKANLTGAQLAQAEAELIQKNDELSKEETDYINKENDFKLRKSAYDSKFGNRLMALRDFEAEAVKIYKDKSNIKQRIESSKQAVLGAELAVNKLQDVVDNTAHGHISDYMNTLEKNTSVFGTAGDHANTRSKDNIRRKYLNKK